MREQKPQVYGFDDFRLDVGNRQLLRDGLPVALASKAFDMLVALVENSGRLLGKDELFSRVWPEQVVEESNLAVHVSAIRKALGDRKERPRYIVTVPGHGYRFAGDVLRVDEEEEELVFETHSVSSLTVKTETEAADYAGAAAARVRPYAAVTEAAASPPTLGAAAVVREASSAEHLAGGTKRHRRGVIALATLFFALAAAFYFYSARDRRAEINSVAVLPFTNVGANADAEYLSDGVTESLINGLSKLPHLRVTARSTAFSYKNRPVEPRQVGRELSVDAVLMGRVTQRGDGLSIQVDLVDVADGSQLWGEQYNRRAADLPAVQLEIYRDISERLRARLTGAEQQRVTRQYTADAEAYRLYLRGRYHWNRRTGADFRKSIEYYNQAIEIDPNFALAYAGLADAYSTLGSYSEMPMKESHPKARAAATRALELDETLAEAHTSLATVLTDYYWEWPDAGRQFQRAIELNPNYATAHQWYANYLSRMGRSDEAIREAKRAQELEPLSLIMNAAVGEAFYRARQYDQAIEQSLKTLDMEPNFVPAHISLGLSYVQKQRYAEAIAEFQKARALTGSADFLGMLGYAYAMAGRRGEAQAALAELQRLTERQYVSPFNMAAIYIALGSKDSAFAWLEKCYDDRIALLGLLKVEPALDPLRSDPRFADLVRRVGLPQ